MFHFNSRLNMASPQAREGNPQREVAPNWHREVALSYQRIHCNGMIAHTYEGWLTVRVSIPVSHPSPSPLGCYLEH